MKEIMSREMIEQRIFLIRGHKVMLSPHLAALYCVEVRALVQAVKRNIKRFPSDFMFQLTTKEKAKVVAICDHLKRLKYSPTFVSRLSGRIDTKKIPIIIN